MVSEPGATPLESTLRAPPGQGSWNAHLHRAGIQGDGVPRVLQKGCAASGPWWEAEKHLFTLSFDYPILLFFEIYVFRVTRFAKCFHLKIQSANGRPVVT